MGYPPGFQSPRNRFRRGEPTQRIAPRFGGGADPAIRQQQLGSFGDKPRAWASPFVFSVLRHSSRAPECTRENLGHAIEPPVFGRRPGRRRLGFRSSRADGICIGDRPHALRCLQHFSKAGPVICRNTKPGRCPRRRVSASGPKSGACARNGARPRFGFRWLRLPTHGAEKKCRRIVHLGRYRVRICRQFPSGCGGSSNLPDGLCVKRGYGPCRTQGIAPSSCGRLPDAAHATRSTCRSSTTLSGRGAVRLCTLRPHRSNASCFSFR